MPGPVAEKVVSDSRGVGVSRLKASERVVIRRIVESGVIADERVFHADKVFAPGEIPEERVVGALRVGESGPRAEEGVVAPGRVFMPGPVAEKVVSDSRGVGVSGLHADESIVIRRIVVSGFIADEGVFLADKVYVSGESPDEGVVDSDGVGIAGIAAEVGVFITRGVEITRIEAEKSIVASRGVLAAGGTADERVVRGVRVASGQIAHEGVVVPVGDGISGGTSEDGVSQTGRQRHSGREAIKRVGRPFGRFDIASGTVRQAEIRRRLVRELRLPYAGDVPNGVVAGFGLPHRRPFYEPGLSFRFRHNQKAPALRPASLGGIDHRSDVPDVALPVEQTLLGRGRPGQGLARDLLDEDGLRRRGHAFIGRDASPAAWKTTTL